MAATYEYPLKWPEGWTRQVRREHSAFTTTLGKSHDFLSREIQRMGGSAIVISANAPRNKDGSMSMATNPADPGCAVYFTRKGLQKSFACDRFHQLKDNVHAIGKTIEAMRGIERWGASSMMERAFAGFGLVSVQAAAEVPEEDWWEVLGVSRTSPPEVIEAVYKTLAKKAHPDNGGSNQAMQRLTRARERALEKAGA